MSLSPPIVIGLMTDRKAWLVCSVALQRFRDVETKLPLVVFNVSVLPDVAVAAIPLLGATLVSLEPHMPVFGASRPHIRMGNGRETAWNKLALWAQPFNKIIFVDVDTLLLHNIDHMAEFPRDTFAPEVCSWPPCVESAIASGINTGVMVIGPSRQTFRAMATFAEEVDAIIQATPANEIRSSHTGTFLNLCPIKSSLARNLSPPSRSLCSFCRKLGLRYFGSTDQSFIREFFSQRRHISITVPHRRRQGWDWSYRTFESAEPCSATEHGRDGNMNCSSRRANVMSRLYNARPLDCERCPATYAPKIVHYSCVVKPWQRTRWQWASRTHCANNRTTGDCAPCALKWIQQWFAAADRMCDTVIGIDGYAAYARTQDMAGNILGTRSKAADHPRSSLCKG